MFKVLVSGAAAFTVPLQSSPAVTSPYVQYAPPAVGPVGQPQFDYEIAYAAPAYSGAAPPANPMLLAAPEAPPAGDASSLMMLCGLGALLGYGASHYRAAFAVSGKRAVKHARTGAPMMQIAPGEVLPGTYAGGVAATRGGPGLDSSILVQGGSLRTWSYRSPMVEQVQVVLSTEGRPLDADVELWHGPDNTPVKMRVYCENGQLRPFSTVIETPRGPNTVAIRNIGQIEFPIAADVIAENVDMPTPDATSASMTVQGGALRTYPFDPTVDSVQVLINTDGRPLNARIELLQGPNNNKQVIELYTEDGCDRPFFCFLPTPGSGNVVRVVNTSPVEFPMYTSVVPFTINQDMGSGAVLGGDVVIGGDVGW
jgi:hypothetical protein